MTSSRAPTVLAGIGGCLFLVVATSSRNGARTPPFLKATELYGSHGFWAASLVGVLAATAVALCLLRWWPYLLLAVALLTVPMVAVELAPGTTLTDAASVADGPRYLVALIGVLACAQSLVRGGAAGLGAVVAGLGIGARLLGTALVGATWHTGTAFPPVLHAVLLVAGMVAVVPAWWAHRGGDPQVVGPWTSARVRQVAGGTLALGAGIPLAVIGERRLVFHGSGPWALLQRAETALPGIVGVCLTLAVIGLALVAGRWLVAGSLPAAVVQIAVVAPTTLAVAALAGDDPVRWTAAVAGVGLGTLTVAGRWRIPAATAATVVAVVGVVLAYSTLTLLSLASARGTADTDRIPLLPPAVLLVVITTAATAVVGATAPALAPGGGLPAALGPVAAGVAAAGTPPVRLSYFDNGGYVPQIGNPVDRPVGTLALLLLAGAGVAGLWLARVLAARRAERKQIERVREEAAEAERDRLARPIHDGVLQVLALVQRHGADARLAQLAGEQEIALRNLLSGQTAAPDAGPQDLRTALLPFAAPAVDVATPAEPVLLPAAAAAELTAAVQAALDNVRRHAGPDARAWVLLEDEDDGVRVTVRDDGAGFEPSRLGEAAARGRLGVAQSMRGRVADLGGSTTIWSRPGEGTEVEFWVPRPAGPR